MSVLKQIESGVRAALADVESRVLLQVLREQLPTMTFGDLRDFLGTQLGRRVQGMSVLEVISGMDFSAAASATPATAPAPARAKGAVPKAKKAAKKAAAAPVAPAAPTKATKATKSAAKVTSAKAPRPAKESDEGASRALDEEVHALLQRARGPVRNGELTAVLGISRFRVLAALQRLVEAGVAATLGHPKRPSYVLTGAAPTPAPAKTAEVVTVPAEAAKEPAAAKASKAPKAAKTKAAKSKATKTKSAKVKSTKSKSKSEAAPAEATPTPTPTPAAPAPAPAATPARAKPAVAADPSFLDQIGLTDEWTLASQLRKGTDLPAHRFTDQMRALLDAGLVERVGNTGQTKYRRASA